MRRLRPRSWVAGGAIAVALLVQISLSYRLGDTHLHHDDLWHDAHEAAAGGPSRTLQPSADGLEGSPVVSGARDAEGDCGGDSPDDEWDKCQMTRPRRPRKVSLKGIWNRVLSKDSKEEQQQQKTRKKECARGASAAWKKCKERNGQQGGLLSRIKRWFSNRFGGAFPWVRGKGEVISIKRNETERAAAAPRSEADMEAFRRYRSWIWLGLVSVVILISLAFEQLREMILHTLTEKGEEDYKRVISRLFEELTTLGFIALCVFALMRTGTFHSLSHFVFRDHLASIEGDEHGGEGHPLLAEMFEEVHMLLFIAMGLLILIALYCVTIAHHTAAKWREAERMSHETLLEIHAHYATRGDRFFWWWQLRRAFARLTHQPLRAEGPVVSRDTLLRWLDYRAIRSEFVKPSVSSVPGVDADPLSFPFYSYLKACMVDFVVELLHIPSWMYFVILVATLPFRSALFCLEARLFVLGTVGVLIPTGLVLLACYLRWLKRMLTPPAERILVFQQTELDRKNHRRGDFGGRKSVTSLAGIPPFMLQWATNSTHSEGGTPSDHSQRNGDGGVFPSTPTSSGDRGAGTTTHGSARGAASSLSRGITQDWAVGSSECFLAPFHTLDPVHATSPLLIAFGGTATPNRHQQLFIGWKNGPKILKSCIQLLVIALAVYTAIMMGQVTDNAGVFTGSWLVFWVVVLSTIVSLLFLIPGIIADVTVVCSIELMKNQHHVIRTCELVRHAQYLKRFKLLSQLKKFSKLQRYTHLADKHRDVLRKEMASRWRALKDVEKRMITASFIAADRGCKMHLTASEAERALQMSGIDMTDQEVKKWFEVFDFHNRGHLDMDSFRMMMLAINATLFGSRLTEDELVELISIIAGEETPQSPLDAPPPLAHSTSQPVSTHQPHPLTRSLSRESAPSQMHLWLNHQQKIGQLNRSESPNPAQTSTRAPSYTGSGDGGGTSPALSSQTVPARQPPPLATGHIGGHSFTIRPTLSLSRSRTEKNIAAQQQQQQQQHGPTVNGGHGHGAPVPMPSPRRSSSPGGQTPRHGGADVRRGSAPHALTHSGVQLVTPDDLQKLLSNTVSRSECVSLISTMNSGAPRSYATAEEFSKWVRRVEADVDLL